MYKGRIENADSLLKLNLPDLGNNNYATLALYPNNGLKIPLIGKDLLFSLLLEALVLCVGLIYLWRRLNKKLLSPLANLSADLRAGKLDSHKVTSTTIFELNELIDALKCMHIEVKEKVSLTAEANAARQVAHDIRSPLASLMLLLSHASALPEEQRTMMRTAVQRITDIVNSLYHKAQRELQQSSEKNLIDEAFMISSLIDSLISEKRIQMREKENVQINLHLEKAYGLFSKVNAAEFKRALSNLINNSLESFDNKPHSIQVVVERVDNLIKIYICDDGWGMPTKIMDKIGEYGFSYGKSSMTGAGSGIGIYHAIQTVKAAGGCFSVDSERDQGTKVTITLPQSKVPFWFIEKIEIASIQRIIILDDDQSIHNLWRERFSSLSKNIELVFFSCYKLFQNYWYVTVLELDKTLFLIDYELLHQNLTGLDVIENMNIAKHAVLVTSYYEDSDIRERANKIRLQMIPKGMAAYVPISVRHITQ